MSIRSKAFKIALISKLLRLKIVQCKSRIVSVTIGVEPLKFCPTSSQEQFKRIALFRLPLIAKRYAGDEIVCLRACEKVLFKKHVIRTSLRYFHLINTTLANINSFFKELLK